MIICMYYNVVIHVMFPATLFRMSGKINYKYFLRIFYFIHPPRLQKSFSGRRNAESKRTKRDLSILRKYSQCAESILITSNGRFKFKYQFWKKNHV